VSLVLRNSSEKAPDFGVQGRPPPVPTWLFLVFSLKPAVDLYVPCQFWDFLHGFGSRVRLKPKCSFWYKGPYAAGEWVCVSGWFVQTGATQFWRYASHGRTAIA